MNKQDEMYFQALSRDRAESADMLEKPSMRGIKNSVVEKYSDQAHFIYELLQNADDAQATEARFILEPNRLIFAHNGTRHFSVTNPADEDRDTEEGKLGDINSITSIANSNKTEASIGKFGVGFKAVFQYTSTPHIYDPEFRFKINRFIVPTLLDDDFPGRRPEETLFVFPFDHSERDQNEAYSDISDKLKNLSFPLLFLTQLKNIEFEFEDILGLYGKEIKETIIFEDTIAEHICLTQNNGDELYDENLWLFSRINNGRKYSVGFFMDKDGKLIPMNEPAFCFFPTKEMTGLNFIIHAPFLLTDSREGIRAGVIHNDKMIQLLAELSAEALAYLRDIGDERRFRYIDDAIIDIIPYDEKQFSDPANKRKVSFMPFYKAIQNKFAHDRLLPSTEGYAEPKNAYWSAVPQLPQLFNNSQLSEIVENQDAKWVFVSLGRDEVQRNNKALFNYLEALVRTNLNEDIILSGRTREAFYNRALGVYQSLESIKGITAKYIEAQNFEWLHLFYKWLSETKHRTEVATTKPIFIDQDGKAAAAKDKGKHSILFLPVKDITGYRVLHQELLNNPETRSFAEQVGIKQPSLKDQIYNIILPLYRSGGKIETDPHFKLFFSYYCKCSNEEVDEFIDQIKEYEFLTFYFLGNPQPYRGAARSMYFPTPELTGFLESKKGARFIALSKYQEMVGLAQEKQLMRFLTALGVKKDIRLVKEEIDYHSSTRTDLPRPYSTRSVSYEEMNLDGCKEIVEYIVGKKNIEKSTLLWDTLLKVIKTNCGFYPYWRFEALLQGTCHYFYRSPQSEHFKSSDAIKLIESAWLVNSNGEFVSPKNVTRGALSAQYNTASDAAQDLLSFLGIMEGNEDKDNEDDDNNLTDEQKAAIRFARKCKDAGINNEADIDEFLDFKRLKEEKEKRKGQQTASGTAAGHTAGSKIDDESDSNEDDYLNELDGIDGTNSTPDTNNQKLDKATSRVVKDIIRKTKEKPSAELSTEMPEDLDKDQDEYLPASIDYSERIKKAKERSAAEISKITYLEELQAKALDADKPKYAFGRFMALLEMESINSGEANANSREISISFSKVEREPGTKRTLVLKHPDRYIPQFMEELADIPLVLHFGSKTKTIAIEVANIKSYTLRVKLKNGGDLEGFDLSTVTLATIDAKSPVFLIEELRKQFIELGKERGFEDDYDLQQNLCENIEFVFGPPGTGKTTYLAQNVLIPMMQNNTDCKVLVLTPTNKSADVLASRIMSACEDTSYIDWLVRFGATGEEEIEQSPVFRDKTFDIRTLRRNVTVTTIARFPYDFFMPHGARIFLHGINWDYIVIDEASMIPIANIVFPLYKKTPRKFIIAGDPFQIEPISSVDLWKNENIYTMVRLDSFTNPKTVPHQYKVELLTTQYRSVPDIGYVFSNFAYGGILKHYRNSGSQRPLNLGDRLEVKTLNIIKFPVSKYESIYRCKRLQHSSSYQVYSALFTFEYVCYLSRAIAAHNPGSLFKIGIIAPYRAESDLIDKLIASEKLPKEIDVQVGTIHGFQGDECDIIFAVYNTPPTISSSKEMFLNKLNIINVSISRARDYLFVVMPDDNTDNVENLLFIKRVEQLIHTTSAWTELQSPDLEERMFGETNYLENNAFSTGHQSVNVYGLPEKRYEVRTEDAAVDVQIHKTAPNAAPKRTTPAEKGSMAELADTVSTKLVLEMTGDSRIPKELRRSAARCSVHGAIEGEYYFVPYTGKLKSHTNRKTIGMYIPVIKNGQKRMVNVSVNEEDRIIYISKELFKQNEKLFSDPDEIELISMVAPV